MQSLKAVCMNLQRKNVVFNISYVAEKWAGILILLD